LGHTAFQWPIRPHKWQPEALQPTTHPLSVASVLAYRRTSIAQKGRWEQKKTEAKRYEGEKEEGGWRKI